MGTIKKDGLEVLAGVLGGPDPLRHHILTSTLFFSPAVVQTQTQALLEKAGEGIPVRFSTKNDYVDDRGNELVFKNRKEAREYSLKAPVQTKVRPGPRVIIDKDGNHAVREEIKNRTGEVIGGGTLRNTYPHYMISHLWARTNDPFFFSSLWNIVITPRHWSYILDLSENSHPLAKEVKDLLKAVCYLLYRDSLSHVEGELWLGKSDFSNQLSDAEKWLTEVQFL